MTRRHPFGYAKSNKFYFRKWKVNVKRNQVYESDHLGQYGVSVDQQQALQLW